MPKKNQPKPEQPPPLFLLVPIEEASQRIAERVAKGKELKFKHSSSLEEFEIVQREYWTWSDYNKEMLRRLFTNSTLADEYSSWGGLFVVREKKLHEKVQELHSDIDDKIHRLESIKVRLELIPVAEGIAKQTRDSSPQRVNTKVFIVHGHDEATRETVARYLEKLRLQPIILHEQASRGQTIIEKIEHYSEVDFAVVLLTPDDVGAALNAKSNLQPRARQNVILELGYFIARLGRSHVCALHKGELELPSDYIGVVYVPLDDNGGWRLQLARELKEAEFEIDLNDAL